MDISFTLDGLDLASKLSTYEVTKEISYRKVITTLDDVEHPYPGASRTIINFSLWPLSEVENVDLWNSLKKHQFMVKYTDPDTRRTETRQMRVTTNLASTFALRSINGYRYYKGGQLTLRALAPD